MRTAWLLALAAACGGDDGGNALTMTTHFTVTEVMGSGVSPLDALANQPVDITVVWPIIDSNRGDGSDPPGCKTTAVGFLPSTRTASGSTAGLVQIEILDRVPVWLVRFQICDAGAGEPSLNIDASINELNLGFGCFGVPASALARDGEGYPRVTSFTADRCSATILDVVNNRYLSPQNFSITIDTGPDHLP